MSDIQHQAASRRFTTHADGHEAYVEYEQRHGVMTITHTIVPSEIGGRGIAGQLVKAAMDHARTEGIKVTPSCSYAADWMDKHPDYADLRV